MKSSLKKSIAKLTGNYMQIDQKFMSIKKSWDDVDKLLQSSTKNKKEKKSKK